MIRIVTLALIISLLLSPAIMFGIERRGAIIEITKSDGMKIKGELIAIKQDSTLLLESCSGISESIGVSEAKVIKIIKGSNTVEGVFLGFLAVGTPGAIIGHSIGYNIPEQNLVGNISRPVYGAYGFVIGGAIGGLAGVLLGGAIGSSIHNDKTFQIEGKSREQIKAVLEKLRTQARFPEYQ